jgi:NADPH:quinone reductase-like Zn-dependent oxidoreductase
MKAAVNAAYGPPEVVRISEVPSPRVTDHDVLIKVHVATVNRTDCGFRSGKPVIVRAFSGLTKPKEKILGCEFAGEVAATGSAVTRYAVGDRVFGFNEYRFGAHAEYLSVPDDGALDVIPPGVTYEQAAAITEGAHYALNYIDDAGLQAQDHVMDYGATGAIGSAAVQLLKARGVAVTAVCPTEHVDLVASLGADRVVDYTATDFTADTQSYDVVLDAVGKSSFGRCKRLLTPHGIYYSTDLGPGAQNPFLGLVAPLMRGRKAKFPLPSKHTRASTHALKVLVEEGLFQPVIDRSYPLNDIVDAYRYVETGRKVGNVLITIASAE